MQNMDPKNTNTGSLYSLDYLSNQTVWYGPYLADQEFQTIISSSIKDWPDWVDYDLTCWIFDQKGKTVREIILSEKAHGDRPVTINLGEKFKDVPPMRGTVAVHMKPTDQGVKIPNIHQEWCVRILDSSGSLQEIVATGAVKDWNFAERKGRKSKFRQFSPALLMDKYWQSVAYFINGSADPAYDVSANLRISVFNTIGDKLESTGPTIPPFGSTWVNLHDVFGQELLQLLENYGGRGSYIVESDDTGCIGYHFFYNPLLHKICGDHTRPVFPYVSAGYGFRPFTIGEQTPKDFLRHAKFLALQKIGRRT
tara:strand:- start:51059 stop:51988 length:930 start_codon:yes stop_codon:yes gene_type:complete